MQLPKGAWTKEIVKKWYEELQYAPCNQSSVNKM